MSKVSGTHARAQSINRSLPFQSGHNDADQNFCSRTSLPGYKKGRQLTTNANVICKYKYDQELMSHIHRCWGGSKTHRKIQRGCGFVNERCSKWFLDCTTTTTARQLLSNVGGLVLQIPLYSAGSGLKAHLTCWAAGNQTVECTCLLSWPTSSLLFNYSRALKCSSVWPTADSPTPTGWPWCQQHYRGSI